MQRPAHNSSMTLSKDSNGPASGSVRPLTVEDALPYSPFSSIVPFGPEPAPVPTVYAAGPRSAFSNSTQEHEARQSLQRMNHEARSSFGVQAVQEISKLLHPQRLSKLKFKQPMGLTGNGVEHDGSFRMHAVQSPIPGLGSFSQMVLDTVDFTHKHPTPATPNTGSLKQDHHSRFPLDVTSKSPRSDLNQTPTQSSHVDPTPRQLLTPDNQDFRPAILVPGLSPSKRKEYEAFPTVSAAVEVPASPALKRLDHRGPRLSNDATVRNVRDSERSDAVVRKLSDLISDILEAEDQLQPDTSGSLPTEAAEFFIPTDVADETAYLLIPTIQYELESAIAKVTLCDRFREIPLDHVVRLQKLCEGAMRAADAVDARLPDASDEAAIEAWLPKVKSLDLGLKSSRTLLTIANGARQEKQIYSEDNLQSILQLLNAACETVIVPIIELRSGGSRAGLYQALSSHKQYITVLFSHTIKILQLLASLIGSEGLPERAVTTAEFLTISLIFFENAHSEKDSIFGVQKGEKLRVVAMDVLVQIFSRYKDHQAFIFDEVLMSLEKLPVTRQRARQYKLADGKSIQLVSALILRLVQSSPMMGVLKTQTGATGPPNGKKSLNHRSAGFGRPVTDEDDDDDHDDDDDDDDESLERTSGSKDSLGQLLLATQPLTEAAQNSAHYVAQFLVSRALKSTKSGDDPYRVLLDIFTEDFLTVLESSSWPASPIILRYLLTSLLGLGGAEKSAAPAKNMALDVLATMGAVLSDTVSRLRRMAKTLENSDSRVDIRLLNQVESYMSGELEEMELLDLYGSFSLVLNHSRGIQPSDGFCETVNNFHLIQWASRLCALSENDISGGKRASAMLVASSLRDAITEGIEPDIRFHEPASQSQALTAYVLLILTTPFGKAFERILVILLNSMNSDQATVRSKGLKSVIHLIEKDATILDKGSYVLRHVINRISDPSPLVRDSALGLLAKCLSLRPTLDEKVLDPILARAADAQVGVRKRSMKILRDIYRRKPSSELRIMIAEALLHRITDSDDGVAELAKQLLEEMWISSLAPSPDGGSESVQRSLILKEQADLIVKTVQRGGSTVALLGNFLECILGDQSKNAAGNLRICKSLVDTLFEDIVDSGDESDKQARQAVMQTLTVFARANAALFRAEQLEHLQVYVEHLSHNDDLTVFRSVVVIFRLVLPQTTTVKTQVLAAVQKALLESLTRLGKRELNEVVACLWTINGVLKTTERLSKVTISCIKAIRSAEAVDFSEPNKERLLTTIIRYINIAGLFGKYCDFESDISRYHNEFPWWKGDAVPSLLIDVLSPLTKPTHPMTLRTSALDGIGAVCQAWPWLYFKEQVTTAFDIVFAETNADLEHLVITGFQEYMAVEEKRSDSALNVPMPTKEKSQSKNLGVAFVANKSDGVSTSLAQRYLKQIVRVALSANDAHALNATEVLASINRQGLVHPKECISALVALETSNNSSIARIAFREHRNLHQKHETIVEKEYTKAVQQVFEYQKHVAADWRGATSRPFTAKLQPAFEVIKSSKTKTRKKFLATLCHKIDFDPVKLDLAGDIPVHVQLVTFLAENLALFDYSNTEEVLQVISCLERLVSTSGTPVAHYLETEVFGSSLPAETTVPGLPEPRENGIRAPDPMRLKQLGTAATILLTAWGARTHLCRLYGLSSSAKPESKGKGSAKDSNRPLTKHPGVHGQSLWDGNQQRLTALAQTDSTLAQCKQFVELMTLDHELKVAAEKDDLPEQERRGSSTDDDGGMLNSPARGDGTERKRRAGKASGRPTAKRQRRTSSIKAVTPGFATDGD